MIVPDLQGICRAENAHGPLLICATSEISEYRPGNSFC